MEHKLIRTRSIIEDCQQHLDDTNSRNSIVEFYFTQYILIVLCAEVQEKIYQIVERRASTTRDVEIKNYVVSSVQRILRSVKKGEIAGFLGLFGQHIKEKLDTFLSEEEITIYNSAVEQRHNVAHKQGAQITFNELIKAVDIADKLVDSIYKALLCKKLI